VFIRLISHTRSKEHDPTIPVDLRPATATAQFFLNPVRP
jgi:hypothetical protein